MTYEIGNTVYLGNHTVSLNSFTGDTVRCLEGVLDFLQSQKEMYENYDKFAARQKGEYEQAEMYYRSECKRLGFKLPEEVEAQQPTTMLGRILQPLSLSFLLAQENPLERPDPKDYEASPSLFVSAGKMLDHEIWIMKWLTHAFPGEHEKAADMLYKDIPALFTGDAAKKQLAEVQETRFFDPDERWSADYHLLCEKSAALKVMDRGYIDHQITLVNQMIAMPNPLAAHDQWLESAKHTKPAAKKIFSRG